MNKKVLIITMCLDPHADAVISELRKLGHEVFRLNTENLLKDYKFQLTSSSSDWQITIEDTENRIINIPQDILSVYYRKPKPPRTLEEMQGNPAAISFAESESAELLKFIYASKDICWVNDPYCIRRAQIKYPQLQVASECGLLTPETLITNNPDEAVQFYNKHKSHGVICKSLITTTVDMADSVHHLYSHVVTEDEMRDFHQSVKYAPTMFQEYIKKDAELRITVIGDKVFGCQIDSQSLPETIHDWRKISPFNIPHKSVDIPSEMSDSILKFLNRYGLSFGAIDMIKKENGEYVFLENNPNGQWYWIEMITGQPMARTMAEHLLTVSNRKSV